MPAVHVRVPYLNLVYVSVRGEAAKDAFTVVFGVGLDIVTAEHWRQELRGIKGCNFSEMSGDTVQYLQAWLYSPYTTLSDSSRA